MDTLTHEIYLIDFDNPTGISHIDELLEFAAHTDGDAGSFPEYFSQLDHRIKSDSLGFVRQGICLLQILKRNLFKFKKFRSFKQYCERSLGKSISYCNRLIQAAEVVLKLINLGFHRLPQNESQCRPLTKIEDFHELREKWQLILDISDSPSHKGIITAQLVADVMESSTGKKSVRLSPGTYEKLQRLSAGTGKSIEELIDEAIDSFSPDENEAPEGEVADPQVPAAASMKQKLANWHADLEDLVAEHAQTRRPVPASMTDSS